MNNENDEIDKLIFVCDLILESFKYFGYLSDPSL